MESLRKALGEEKINFYGFSYGTYLGQVYATLHPTRVRRFVFDGTVDPQRVFYKSNQDQDRAFQKTFEIYFRWLAKYHEVYHVGDTFQEVRKTYLATIAKLDKNPEGPSAAPSSPTCSPRPATTSTAGRTSPRPTRRTSTRATRPA